MCASWCWRWIYSLVYLTQNSSCRTRNTKIKCCMLPPPSGHNTFLMLANSAHSYHFFSGVEDLCSLLLRTLLLITLPLQVTMQQLLQGECVSSAPPSGGAEDLTRWRAIQEHWHPNRYIQMTQYCSTLMLMQLQFVYLSVRLTWTLNQSRADEQSEESQSSGWRHNWEHVLHVTRTARLYVTTQHLTTA